MPRNDQSFFVEMTMDQSIQILPGNLDCPEVAKLLQEHLAEMHSVSPPESTHALDLSQLKHPSVSFWTAHIENRVVGCAALKNFGNRNGEIKSMRTAVSHRGMGIGRKLIMHILATAKTQRYERLYLETGSMEFFQPARKLYEEHGFVYCPPFGDYVEDPNSVFMSLEICTENP